MKVNFDIVENYALSYEARHVDLHNNFDFTGFAYDVKNRELKLSWIKANGDWIDKNEVAGLVLVHKAVTYLTVSDQDEQSTYNDDSCLGEISFFPSTAREINDSIIPQAKPKDGDDILYFFENGQQIRVHCDEIELKLK